jgi:hypothetical protein
MSENSGEIKMPSAEHKVTSFRFQKALEVNRALVTTPPEVKGWENFYNLPDGIRPVVATTHMTDTDVQIGASIFSPLVDVGVASLQTNQTDALIGKLVALAGKENFFNIANTFEEGKPHFQLNPENFVAMAQAVNEKDKTMVIASHSPVYDKRQLPDTAGIAAAIVANLTDRVILPVAVEIKSDERVGMSDDMVTSAKKLAQGKRPPSQVHIAEPIFLDELPAEYKTSQADVFAALGLLDGARRKNMTASEKALALKTLRRLQKQGEVVLMAQAAELPKEMRGKWDQVLAQDPMQNPI